MRTVPPWGFKRGFHEIRIRNILFSTRMEDEFTMLRSHLLHLLTRCFVGVEIPTLQETGKFTGADGRRNLVKLSDWRQSNDTGWRSLVLWPGDLTACSIIETDQSIIYTENKKYFLGGILRVQARSEKDKCTKSPAKKPIGRITIYLLWKVKDF